MKTRQNYLSRECSHREYYAQFVTKGIISAVKSRFEEQIISSQDEHFNDIKLAGWDALAGSILSQNFDLRDKLKEAGDAYSMAGGVCILKEAAKQIKEATISV